MQYIEAPSVTEPIQTSVFLGGGISGCPDWQAYVVKRLVGHPMSIFNPRRKHFPMGDPDADRVQIPWEFKRLQKAHINAYWFAKETVNPIAIGEYFESLARGDLLVVGIDPGYTRQIDIEMRFELYGHDPKEIVFTLDAFADRILQVLTLFNSRRVA